MEQHINYITLGVADLAESRRFYRDVFGWQETAGSNENIAFFQAGNALLLALFGKAALARDAQIPEQSSGFPRFTLAHNVGSEAEVDALFAGFAAKNANIIKAPQKVLWGGYSGYLTDPDGFLWEIAFNPFLQKLR
ncbi:MULTISPECIES: VOC family protein [Eikenella]|uniref:VOC family protein n=1 Tax=Eikenella TaxID=538 RepID=UPI0008A465D6|nr:MULTISPECIES: VOC family protein [Eikenella]MDU4301474.1 VOC family protein [Eikenella corrodens]OFN58027.1 glyoxalase [Eikenella sp. HMSC061C02]OWP27710.1 glyoxalase [Eikenella corrodens]